MGGKRTEYCGRCAMSSVVDASQSGDDADDAEAETDPFGSARIELDDAQLRAVSPSAWLSGLRERLDDVATSLTYGRSR